jgi:IS30 family transposase
MGKYKFLTAKDRERIAAWYLNGERPCDMAAWLEVHTATIYNELARGRTGALDKNQRLAYDPELAQRTLQEGFKRRGHRTEKPVDNAVSSAHSGAARR